MAEPQTNQNIGFKISFYVFDKGTKTEGNSLAQYLFRHKFHSLKLFQNINFPKKMGEETKKQLWLI